MHDFSSFVTLTYDDPFVDPSLNYRQFQKFMYRVRKRFGRVPFFASGEYGETTWRPHFHALLFGVRFPDMVPCGRDLYTSKTLQKLWGHGFVSIGDVTLQSAAYVAGYCLKKVNGAQAIEHYSKTNLLTGECVQLTPEFGRMSLRPAIGYNWFVRNCEDVCINRDGVVLPGGQKRATPRAYDKWLCAAAETVSVPWLDERVAEIKASREAVALYFASDSTPNRLSVREAVTKARVRARTGVL